MGKSFFKVALGLTSALGLIHAAPGFAQSRDQGASENSADIVVTARRIEENIRDVPISITVFNQKELAAHNIVQAEDLATYTPSLSVSNVLGSVATSFAIRGFVQDGNTQPTVGVYFADVVAPRAPTAGFNAGDGAGAGAFFDLQNVQVLKGPQGTLFGRNTTGGDVLLVPQKPTDKFEGFVEGTYGNYNQERIQAVLNLPLGEKARLRLGVDHNQRDGYLRNTTGVGPDRFDDLNYTAARASFVVDLTPDLENYTIGSYSRTDQNGDLEKVFQGNAANVPTGVLFAGQVARDNAAGYGFYTVQNPEPNANARVQQYQIINTTTWRASDTLTLKNIASYAQLKYNIYQAVPGAYFDASNLNGVLLQVAPGFSIPFLRAVGVTTPIPAGTYVNLSSVRPIPNGNTAHSETITDEFRLQGTALDAKLQYQMGVYYEVSNPLGLSGSNSYTLLNCASVASPYLCANPTGVGSDGYQPGQIHTRSLGVYSQATYALTDQFKITGGIRYTSDLETASGQQQTFSYAPSNTPAMPVRVSCADPTRTFPCPYSYRQTSKKPTWLIDLDYKPTDAMLLYVKYARGYRAGGIVPNVDAAFATFKPEKLDTFEGGFKGSFGGALRPTLDLAAFYNKFSNQQLQATLTSSVNAGAQKSGEINAGKSKLYGIEAAAGITPFDGFQLNGSYTYLKTRVDQVTIPTPAGTNFFVDPASVVKVGDRVMLTPKHKFSGTAAYTLPLDASIGRVTASATYSYQSNLITSYLYRDANGKPTGLSLVPRRGLLDLALSWNHVGGSHFDVSAYATNVTEKHYVYFILPLGAGGTAEQVGQPRFFGARLRYNFGG